jgi:hypothetical protein
MNKILICIACFLSVTTFGQLKKNVLGVYTGTISGYEINTGQQFLQVAATPVEVQITKDSLFVQIGVARLRGTHEILLDKSDYYVLVGTMQGQLANERIVLYKKGKKLSREGIQPQPDAMLTKKKK